MAHEQFDFEGWIGAAERGDDARLRDLLAAGADPDARGPSGETALMRAAARGHAAAVRLLLEHGADPDLRRRDEWTALMLAAFFGHAEAARALVGSGARVDAHDRHGSSAFQWASARGHIEIAHLLGDAEAAATAAGSPPARETQPPAPATQQPRDAAPQARTSGAPQTRRPAPAPSTPPPSMSPPAVSPALPARPQARPVRDVELDAPRAAAHAHAPEKATPATEVKAVSPVEVFDLVGSRTTTTPAFGADASAMNMSAPDVSAPDASAKEAPAATGARAAAAAQPGRFRHAAFVAVALLVVGGVALAYRLAGPGGDAAASQSPTASTPDAQQPKSAQTQAMPVAPIASPAPVETATPAAAGLVPSIPAGDPYASYVTPAPGAPTVTLERGAVREIIPPNQPPPRPAGGEPAVVNLGRPEEEEATTRTRPAQDDDAPSAPAPRPARRDDDAQDYERPARTPNTPPRATPTPRGKVIQWP